MPELPPVPRSLHASPILTETRASVPARILELGLVEYTEAHARQQTLVAARANGEIPDTVVLLEHPHVFTRGRKARDERNVLAAGDIPVIAVERGGDVTYHGPGQLVAYPIFGLGEGERDAPGFIRRLERWVVDALAAVGVDGAAPRRGYAGVWVGEKKVTSVGVAVTAQWVTWHGIAINVCNELSYFERINPCGMHASVMTSVSELTGRAVDIPEMKAALLAAMPHTLGRHGVPE